MTTPQRKVAQEKQGVDFQNYVILGAYNPALAYHALQEEINIGLLFDCLRARRALGSLRCVCSQNAVSSRQSQVGFNG